VDGNVISLRLHDSVARVVLDEVEVSSSMIHELVMAQWSTKHSDICDRDHLFVSDEYAIISGQA